MDNKLLEICILIYTSFVSSSPKNQVSYFTLDKSCDRLKLYNSAKKTLKKREGEKKGGKKMHAVSAFQSVTSFEI